MWRSAAVAAEPGQVVTPTHAADGCGLPDDDLGPRAGQGVRGRRAGLARGRQVVAGLALRGAALPGIAAEIVGRATPRPAGGGLGPCHQRPWAGGLLVGEAGIGKSGLRGPRSTRRPGRGDGAQHRLHASTGNTPLFPIGVLLRRTASIAGKASDGNARRRRGCSRGAAGRGARRARVPRAAVRPLTANPEEVTPAAVRDQTVARGQDARAADRARARRCSSARTSTGPTNDRHHRRASGRQIERAGALMIVTMRPGYGAAARPGGRHDDRLPPSPPQAVQLVSPWPGAPRSRRGSSADRRPVRRRAAGAGGGDARHAGDAAQRDRRWPPTRNGQRGAPPLQLVVESRLGRWPTRRHRAGGRRPRARVPVDVLARCPPTGAAITEGSPLIRQGVFARVRARQRARIQAHDDLRGGLQHAARQRPEAPPLPGRRHPARPGIGGTRNRAGRARRAPSRGRAWVEWIRRTSRRAPIPRRTAPTWSPRAIARRRSSWSTRSRPGAAAELQFNSRSSSASRSRAAMAIRPPRSRACIACARGVRRGRGSREALSDHPRASPR